MAFPAPSQVGSSTNSNQVTLSSPVAAGDLLIVCFGGYQFGSSPGNFTGFSDPTNGAWTTLYDSGDLFPDGNHHYRLVVGVFVNSAAAGSLVVTAAGGGLNAATMAAVALAGADDTAPVVQHADDDNLAVGGDVITSPPLDVGAAVGSALFAVVCGYQSNDPHTVVTAGWSDDYLHGGDNAAPLCVSHLTAVTVGGETDGCAFDGFPFANSYAGVTLEIKPLASPEPPEPPPTPTPVVARTGFAPVVAPAQRRRVDDLLAVSRPVDPANSRWLSGVWSGGHIPGPAFTHDPCSQGTERVKMEGGVIPSQTAGRFVVYVPAQCTAQSVGSNPDAFIEDLLATFALYEGAAVERTLATGDGHEALGSYLGDANMEELASGAVDGVTALALLENALARNGGGIIHAAPSTVVAWDAANLTRSVGPLTYTKRGTPVAVGAGYIDVVPDGAAALSATEQWAFASGPIEIIRDREITIPASSYAEMLDRSLNDVFVLAERSYVFNWIARQDPADTAHVQAGVLVDSSACCGGVDVIDVVDA